MMPKTGTATLSYDSVEGRMEGELGTREGDAVAEAFVKKAMGLPDDEMDTGRGDPTPEKLEPDFSVIDNRTGEITQLTLLGAQWEMYKVFSTKLSFSGGEEFLQAVLNEVVTGDLAPGAVVEVQARGIVKEAAPIYKNGLHEGKVVITLDVIRKINVVSRMTGKVEAAQNVDGEPKDEGMPGDLDI